MERRLRGVTVSKQATLALSADDWDLYTSSMDCSQAAQAINEAIQTAFNRGDSEAEVRRRATAVMQQYADYGAMDTEPRGMLEAVLEYLYA